ncbi:MAG: hypothetical protein JNM80_10120 [Phycisphaerae bacterium]|nr:hypothetical protein [Phycisphaerae bacterium]
MRTSLAPSGCGIVAMLLPVVARAQVLYDNGPYLTHPGGGAGGAGLSAVQTTLNLQSQGFSMIAPADRLADDFTIPGPAAWTLEAVEFLAFQTNSSTSTPTFTSINLRIWSARPGDPGSTILFGDTTTNVLLSAAWANSFRALDTEPLNATRPIMAVRAAIVPPLTLPPGTYWIDWQAAGSLPSGPWCVPVTILGETAKPGANARQFLNAVGAWRDARDSLSQAKQDMTFRILGTSGAGPQPCYANCDGSTIAPVLNVNDFVCFNNLFAGGDSRANCDASTTAPVLNVNDFVCFNNRFVAGCSAP